MSGTGVRARRRAWGCVVLLLAGIVSGNAQTAGVQPITADTEAELRAMSRLAAVIFAGQVTAVRRLDGAGGATGVIEIEFAVEEAVRGVSGGAYTLREWAGLWAANEPFRVGERYLMLLHAPGVAGLNSPVGGADGAIPIRAGTQGISSPAGASASRVVDLRWVAARVARPIAYRAEPEPVRRAGSAPGAVRANAVKAGSAQVDLAGPSQASRVAAGGADYAAVLGLLRGWEKAGDAPR